MINQPSLDDIILRMAFCITLCVTLYITFYMILCVRIFQ